MSKCLFGYLLIMESKGTNLIIACQQALSECCWSLVACCYSQSVTCKAPKKEIATFGELSSCPVSLTFHHLRGTPLQLGLHITSSRGPTLTFHQTSNLSAITHLSTRSSIHPQQWSIIMRPTKWSGGSNPSQRASQCDLGGKKSRHKNGMRVTDTDMHSAGIPERKSQAGWGVCFLLESSGVSTKETITGGGTTGAQFHFTTAMWDVTAILPSRNHWGVFPKSPCDI